MTQVSTYQHYPSFTRRYVRSVMRSMGLSKNAVPERELLGQILRDPAMVDSINGEIFLLEWLHGKEGQVIVPEPTLSSWLQEVKLSRVEGNAWDWPYEFSTLSLPTKQTFAGHAVEGVMVAWVDSETLPGRYADFLSQHVPRFKEAVLGNVGGPWLIVAVHNPLDTRRSLDPSMLRAAFRPDQITDFINQEAINPAEGARLMNGKEGEVLREVVRYVISLGMYLSAYPQAMSPGVPAWMKNKHPENRKGIPFRQVGYDSTDRELQAAMLSPRSVGPHWRQLRDERFYRREWASWPRGSRHVLVSGYEVGSERTVGVE